MNSKDVEIVNEETVYDGFADIVKYQLRHRLFSGEWSPVIEREIYRRRDAVGVVVYDPKQETIALVEQFRPGCLGREFSPWSMELVAGLIEPGERLEVVAAREVKEEAGVEVQPEDCRFLFDYLSSPGGSSERVYMFYVEAPLHPSQKTFGVEMEDIRLHILSLKEAYAACLDGRIRNAMTLLGIMRLAIEKGLT